MKVIRFLTTFIIFQLICFGQVRSQDIAEFEIQKSTPAGPFPAHLLPLDDNGHVLPSNQCKSEWTLHQTNKCGFSAGWEDHNVAEKSQTVVVKKNHDIDLSPLSFQCMDSGCEFEYANSAREFRANLQAIEKENESQARAEAKKIIESVFAKTANIDEIVEDHFSEYEFVPYFDPENQLGLEPVTPTELTLAPLEDYRSLTQFWIDSLNGLQVLQQPLDFAQDQLIEIECQLCGSPLLNLIYGVQASIRDAEADIAREQEIIEVQKNALILNGFASVARKMGESLIGLSDSIVRISNKRVESFSSHRSENIR